MKGVTVSGLIFINDKKIFPSDAFLRHSYGLGKNEDYAVGNIENESNDIDNLARVKRVIEKYNRALESQGKEVQMNFDEEINRVVIRIFDRESSKLVYEFPYKEIRHLIAMLQKFNDTIFNEIV